MLKIMSSLVVGIICENIFYAGVGVGMITIIIIWELTTSYIIYLLRRENKSKLLCSALFFVFYIYFLNKKLKK